MTSARLIVVAATVLVAVHAIGLGTLTATPTGRLLSNLVQLALPALAAIAAALSARRSSDYGRRFWNLMSAGFAFWATGAALYMYYENYLQESIPSFSPTDVPYLLYYLPLAAAVFLWPKLEAPRGVDWGRILDLTQVAIVLTTIYLYYFFFVATAVTSRQAMLRLGLINLYDLLNLLLLGGFLARWATARSREVRLLFGRMLLMLFAYALGDGLFTVGLKSGSGGTGSWFDLGYSIPFALGAVLAATWRQPEAEATTVSSLTQAAGDKLQSLLPVLAPLVVLALAAKIAAQEFDLALIVVGASVLCYSARLAFTQHLQQRAVHLLRQSEVRYRELVENMTEVVYSTDLAGRITYVSPSVERLYGYKPEELIGRSMLEFVPPEDQGDLSQRMADRIAGRTPWTVERRVLTKTGEARWILGSSRAVMQEGRPIGVTGFIMDVDDRVTAEQARRDSEEKLSKMFRLSPDAISISSVEDGRFLEVNEAYLRLSGYQREELIGRTALEMGIWADPSARARMLEQLRKEGVIQNLEVVIRAKEGQEKVVLVSLEIMDINGQEYIVAFSRDITERRSLEERFRQSQKMEAVGRLAGGIAHDFNNILTVISGYAQLLQERKDAGIAEEAGSIAEAANRAASLTRQLLAFGRQQVLEPRVIHLNDIVRSMEKMLRRLIGEDVELVTVLAQDAGAVQADPSQIEQIIMNLVVNARDAMPAGGRIIVETMNTELSHSYVHELREVEPGNYVMLAVSDTGTGMDAQTQARIFEPFFTTKEMGRGTGLGLSTVYGIVTQSQGHIWVYSEVGHGTTFKIYFPRVEEPSRVERLEPQPAGVVRGAETILLVEDDRALRNLAVKILRREGYTVLEAEGSVQAEEICRLHQGHIDLILTDMVMPQMSGRELVQRARALRPRMRVLYMSGYTEYAATQRTGFELDAPLISKPFTSVTLSSKIREVLQQPAA